MSTSIASSFSNCLGVYQDLVAAVSDSNLPLRDEISLSELEDELGRLKVWAGNIAAHKVGRASLDFRLRDASPLRDRIIGLLQDMEGLLREAIPIITGDRKAQDEAASDTDSSDDDTERSHGDQPQHQFTTELQQTLLDVVDIIDCLYKLSITIRNPSPHDRLVKAASVDTSFYEHWDIQHVKNKFPAAKEYLAARLGKAISKRRQFLQYREKHRKKLGQDLVHPPKSTPGKQPLKHDIQVTPTAHIPLGDLHDYVGALRQSNEAEPSIVATTVLTQTTASEFFGGNAEFEEESDSGQTQTSYATSVGNEGSLSIPPLPKESQGGKPFECQYCFTIVCIKNSRSWRKHILRDLQPYVCTSESCNKGSKIYDSRHEWFDHELLNHRKEWFCTADCQQSFTLQSDFEDHIRQVHASTFTEHQLPALGDMCQRPVEEDSEAQCPLCVATIGTTKQLCRHLARHLEALATFALPRNKDDDKEEGFGSERVQLSDASRGLSDGTLSFSSKSHSSSEESDVQVETDDHDEISEFMNDFTDSERLPPSFTQLFQQQFQDFLDTGQDSIILQIFSDVGEVILGPDFEQLMDSESNVRDIISLFYLEATASLEKYQIEGDELPRSSHRSHRRTGGGENSSEEGRRRLRHSILKPDRTHRKERIVTIDALPIPGTPPQMYNQNFTAASSPMVPPRIVDERRGRPIIVDKRPHHRGTLDEAAALFIQLMSRTLAATGDAVKEPGLVVRLEGLRNKLLARSGRMQMMRETKAIEESQLHDETDRLLSPDWAKCWGITEAELVKFSDQEITRQQNIHAIWTSERIYLEGLNTMMSLYQDDLIDDPSITEDIKRLEFIENIFARADDVRKVHEPLLELLRTRLLRQGPLVESISGIFRKWSRPEVREAYFQYARQFPSSEVLIQNAMKNNPQFRQVFEKGTARVDWLKYLRNPMGKIQQIIRLLIALRSNEFQEPEVSKILQEDIDEMQTFYSSFESYVQMGVARASRTELAAKLVLGRGMEDIELNLEDKDRQLFYKGDLIRRSANGTILINLACLFDNYFILSAPVRRRHTADSAEPETVYEVKKMPIPISLLLLEYSSDERIPMPEKMPTTGLDASFLFPFRIKHLGKPKSYTLYTKSPESRNTWREQIIASIEAHTSSEELKSKAPFLLKVIADTAFQPREHPRGERAVMIKGSALDKAIQAFPLDHQRRPLGTRMDITCATTFHLHGIKLVAIGTDEGFSICGNDQTPGGWREFISLSNVRQIFVIEEHNIFVVLTSDALSAYRTNAVCDSFNGSLDYGSSGPKAPPRTTIAKGVKFFEVGRMKERDMLIYAKKEGLSTSFKVLEPIYYNPAKRKVNLFSFRKSNDETTEIFREFDEFYLSSECFGINMFKQWIAVSTGKGIELLTLDRKIPINIPDFRSPPVVAAARLQGQRPLGMFRLPAEEFFCAYEHTGIYLDKHGEVSRPTVVEFVGRAKKAALVDQYILLFHDDFVEIRDVWNGKLRQIIAGENIRCLDHAQGGFSNRNILMVMAYPCFEDRQLVLELRVEKSEDSAPGER